MQGIIFIGAQASGKSTFYLQRFYSTHIRLSMDMLKTRHRESLLFTACLQSKQPFVIDNTNPTQSEREKYLSALKSHRFTTTGYFFASTLQDCLSRNAQREGKACIPEKGVRGTFRKLELPQYGEGFDELYYVTLDEGGFRVQPWAGR